MVDGHVDITDPFYYAWFGICFFLAIWFTSNVIRFSMENFTSKPVSEKFMALDEEKQRNIVTYVMECLVTTFALFCQLYGGQDVLFRRSDTTTPDLMNWMTMSLQSISILYVWELIYRERFGWPLLLHHLVTLLFVQLVVVSFFTEYQMLYIRFALILGFYATTEQTSFVALFCFRLKIYEKHLANLFYVSAVQTFIIKSLVTISALVYYAICIHDGSLHREGHSNWGKFWALCFVPLLGLLFFSQVYASNILYIISKRCRLEYNTDKIEAKRQEFASMKTKKNALRRGSVRILDTFENTTRDVDMATSIRRSMSIVRPSVRRQSMSIRDLSNHNEPWFDEDSEEDKLSYDEELAIRKAAMYQKSVRILDSFENSQRSERTTSDIEEASPNNDKLKLLAEPVLNSRNSENTGETALTADSYHHHAPQYKLDSDDDYNEKVHVLHHTLPKEQQQKQENSNSEVQEQPSNEKSLYSGSMFGDIEMKYEDFMSYCTNRDDADSTASSSPFDESASNFDESDTNLLAKGYEKSCAPTPDRRNNNNNRKK